MTESIRCKRIIEGKTYNTETATQLGPPHDDGPFEARLFKTRHGAYFLYVFDDTEPSEGIEPLDPPAAQRWLERHCPSAAVIEAEFGLMPEAGQNEARITLRVPESLRQRIAALAQARDQSLNAWIVRCLERCSVLQSAEPAEGEKR
jgi:hypothetical protein